MGGDVRTISISEAKTKDTISLLSSLGHVADVVIPFHHGQGNDDFDHVTLRAGPPVGLNVSTLENAFLLIGPGLDGVVFDSEGSLIRETSTYTGATFEKYDLAFLQANATDLAMPLVSIFDPSWRNYYHWTVLGLGKAMLYRKFCKNKNAILIPDRKGRDQLGWVIGFSYDVWRESLVRADITSNALVVKNGVYRIKSLDVLWLTTAWGEAVDQPPFISLFPELYECFQTVSVQPRRAHRSDIIVSRPHDVRVSPNANDALKRLARYENFKFVDLQTMRFDAQTALFSEARTVIAPHGAGLSNLVYSSPATQVIELSQPLRPREKLRPWFYLISAGIGQPYSYVDLNRYDGGTAGLYDRIIELCHARNDEHA